MDIKNRDEKEEDLNESAKKFCGVMIKIGVTMLILLGMMFLFPNVSATYTISGYVVDEDNTILNGVALNITNTTHAQTNESGFYSFVGVSNGSYTAHAYLSGYKTNDLDVVVNGSNESNQNITLDSWKLDPATSSIELPDDSAYDVFYEGVSEFNWTKTTTAMSMPFTGIMGNIFFLLLFLPPYLMAWIRQESVIIPLVWGFLLGGVMTAFLPKEYVYFAWLILILAGVGALYGVFKERF